jgi:WD40 repeat protein
MSIRVCQVSKDGSQFVIFAADGRVRVWRFATGKLSRSYDESLEVRVTRVKGPICGQWCDLWAVVRCCLMMVLT